MALLIIKVAKAFSRISLLHTGGSCGSDGRALIQWLEGSWFKSVTLQFTCWSVLEPAQIAPDAMISVCECLILLTSKWASCIESAFLVTVDHLKSFLHCSSSYTGSSDYLAWWSLLIRSVNHSLYIYTHTLIAQHQEQFGVQCLSQGHLNMFAAGYVIEPGIFRLLDDNSTIWLNIFQFLRLFSVFNLIYLPVCWIFFL